MARTYRRDARGRFASGGGGKGGGSKGGGKAKPAAGKSKPAATGKPKAKSKTASKPAPATRKPVTRKPQGTTTKKPALPPRIPENLLKAAGVARAGAAVRRADGPANKIAASPRRLNAAESAYVQITTGKGRSKFKSDRKVREELQRRGFLKGSKDPQGDLIRIAAQVRRKKGTDKGPYNYWGSTAT